MTVPPLLPGKLGPMVTVEPELSVVVIGCPDTVVFDVEPALSVVVKTPPVTVVVEPEPSVVVNTLPDKVIV